MPVGSARVTLNDVRRVLVVQEGSASPGLLTGLARYGFRVVVAGGARAGNEIVQRVPLRAVVCAFRLAGRSGIWLLEQVRDLQPRAQRIMIIDDPRIDINRLRANDICHCAVTTPFKPARVLDLLAGVPDLTSMERTPIVSPG